MEGEYSWCSVLEDVSETIVSLVTEKGNPRIEYHFPCQTFAGFIQGAETIALVCLNINSVSCP